MASKNFITARDALDYLNDSNVSFVDGSWYLPAQERDAKAEFHKERIANAVYFDIDAIADPDTNLPHMLPHPDVFADVAGILGLKHDKLIIVYDGPGLFSAPRVWWTLKIMGAKNVKILEGGFDGWKAQGLPINKSKPAMPSPAIFQTHFLAEKVISMNEVEASSKANDAKILDARPEARFKGKAPEPRAGLRSGHIPNSLSLPASELVENGKLINTSKLEEVFKLHKIHHDTKVITSCGSGVTAAILTLALDETGRQNTKLFDGSWAEWGLPNGPEVNTK